MTITTKIINGLEVLVAGNNWISCEMVPSLGGKIISVWNRKLNKEFLWTNDLLQLEQYPPGTEYDSHFLGGIDELIPNDIPESIDGVELPDHGELWTTALQYKIENGQIRMSGRLPLCELYYEKIVSFEDNSPEINIQYHIINKSNELRHFMWKLHAALKIKGGERIQSPALKAKVADVNYSRFKYDKTFQWPFIENTDASVVPAYNGGMDFFYLSEIDNGEMELSSPADGTLFSITYDKKIFPFQWIFSSYGGFNSHYTAILEPCSTMPISVNDASLSGHCSVLAPGEAIQTGIGIYAGPSKVINQ